MKQLQINNLHLWQFDNLRQETSIKHFVTDRNSNTNGKEFTLSYSSSPNREEIKNNRHLLALALGISDSKLFFPSQVHQTKIVHVTSGTAIQEVMETDALITNEPGVCIAVMSADCVPILLYDKKNKAVGAVHSGWKGTVARILEKTLLEMHARFGTKGEDVVAGVGPSVSQDSYEVGEEVVNAVNNAFGNEQGLMIAQPNNKAKLDLWKANTLQLNAFGVPASQIELSDLCSIKNNHHFFSARKGDKGRYAAGIMLQ
jgi:YfiH family protein